MCLSGVSIFLDDMGGVKRILSVRGPFLLLMAYIFISI